MMILGRHAASQYRLFSIILTVFALFTSTLAALIESPNSDLNLTGVKPEYHIGETATVNANVSAAISGTFSIILYLRLPTGLALIQTIGVETAQTVRPFTFIFNSSLPSPYNYSVVAQQDLTILDIEDFTLLPAINATTTTSSSTSSKTTTSTPSSSTVVIPVITPTASPASSSSNQSFASTHRTSVAAVVVASIAIVLLLLGLFWLLCARRRRRNNSQNRNRRGLTPSMTSGPATTFNNSSRRPSALTTLVDRAVRRYQKDSKSISSRHYRHGSDEPAFIPRDYKTHTLLSSFPSPPPRLFPASPPPPMPRLFPNSPPPAPIIPAPLPLPDLGNSPPERFVYTSDGEILTALPPCTPPTMRFNPPPFGGWDAAFAGGDRRRSSVGQRVSAWVYERRAAAQVQAATSPTTRGAPGGVTRWWGN